MYKHNESLIGLLLKHIKKRLAPRNAKLTLTRVSSACKFSESFKTRVVRFKTLTLPELDIPKLILKQFLPLLAGLIPKDDTFLIESSSKQYRSIKHFLCNGHQWFKTADAKLVPCKCAAMRRFFKLPPQIDHYTILMRDTFINDLLPPKCSADTILLPDRFTIVKSVVAALKHIVSKLNLLDKIADIDPTGVLSAIDGWYDKLYAQKLGPFVRAEVLRSVKARLDELCLVSAVDKSKSDLAFLCPQLAQHALLSLNTSDRTLHTDFDGSAVKDNFSDMQVRLAYNGIPFPMRSHDFGVLSVLPKSSGIVNGTCNKWRPLGSYKRHCGRNALSTACE